MGINRQLAINHLRYDIGYVLLKVPGLSVVMMIRYDDYKSMHLRIMSGGYCGSGIYRSNEYLVSSTL